MNVLILTPDRVGSTLLQRLITVYMNMHEFDQPVINLHELTNGLIKYLNSRFNREVLGKPNTRNDWGYYQTLPEIVELLQGVDHYKTSRLAHYHIVNRQDSIQDQLGFYQYLNDNFFIVSAQRENLLEHALSWCIQLHSKKLNVFSHQEKLDAFVNLYQNKITVEPESIVKYLDQYRDYLNWVNDHFQVTSYFKYERDLPQIEQYILNLPIFNNRPKITWESNFGINWTDWNKCHYLLSDLSGLSTQVQPLKISLERQEINPKYQLQVSTTATDVVRYLSTADQRFIQQNVSDYQTVDQALAGLVEDKVLVTPVPIKLQTMAEKKLLIKNFNQCVSVYNQWVNKHKIGTAQSDETLSIAMQRELVKWHQQAQLT